MRVAAASSRISAAWRRRLAAGEVVGADLGEVDVGCEERRPDRVPDHLLGADEIEELVGCDVGYHEGKRGGGQDAADAALVELGDRDGALVAGLLEQQPGDQEA